jgi:hypothetical protein
MLTGGLPSNRSIPIFHRSQTKHTRAYDHAPAQMRPRDKCATAGVRGSKLTAELVCRAKF